MADTAMVEDRRALVRQAFFLEYVTLLWMTIEAGVAIISGIAAHSITLLAFGFDSLIELASAGVLAWRLMVELRHGQSFAESAERAASRIGGALLFALAAYIVGAVGWSLWTQQGQAFSWLGLLISVTTVAREAVSASGMLGQRRKLSRSCIRSHYGNCEGVPMRALSWTGRRRPRRYGSQRKWHVAISAVRASIGSASLL
jgi:hypothetical protein